MEIEKCSCGHNALRYYGIDRHLAKLFDGKVIYSDLCQEPNCRCERAKILKPETDIAIQKEKQRWEKVIQEVMG